MSKCRNCKYYFEIITKEVVWNQLEDFVRAYCDKGVKIDFTDTREHIFECQRYVQKKGD